MIKRKRKINKQQLVQASLAHGLRHLKVPMVIRALLGAGIDTTTAREMVRAARAVGPCFDCPHVNEFVIWADTPHFDLWEAVDSHQRRWGQ